MTLLKNLLNGDKNKFLLGEILWLLIVAGAWNCLIIKIFNLTHAN